MSDGDGKLNYEETRELLTRIVTAVWGGKPSLCLLPRCQWPQVFSPAACAILQRLLEDGEIVIGSEDTNG